MVRLAQKPMGSEEGDTEGGQSELLQQNPRVLAFRMITPVFERLRYEDTHLFCKKLISTTRING